MDGLRVATQSNSLENVARSRKCRFRWFTKAFSETLASSCELATSTKESPMCCANSAILRFTFAWKSVTRPDAVTDDPKVRKHPCLLSVIKPLLVAFPERHRFYSPQQPEMFQLFPCEKRVLSSEILSGRRGREKNDFLEVNEEEDIN